MADQNVTGVPALTLGDRVKIRHTSWKGRIVELRGPLGPGGAYIYRVQIRRMPEPMFIEVREDQLVVLPPKADLAPTGGPR
jgi:hypothetical protein